MSTLTRTATTDSDLDEIPVDRLQRLTPEQFRLASEAGAFPEADRVELVDGLLRQGGPFGPLYRLSLDQLHRMYVVPGLERNELLGGWLVARTPIHPPHRISTRRVRIAVDRALPDGWYSDEQKPITLPLGVSEPLPDLQVVRGGPDDYPDRHAGPADLGLLVEVSDSSASIDRNYKLRLYAREGIPIYWIVNLVAMRLEVYTDPSGPAEKPGYRNRQDYGPDDEVPLILDGREVGRIPVRDLLP